MVWSELVDGARFSQPKDIQVLVLGDAPISLRPKNTCTVGFTSLSVEEGGKVPAKLAVFAVTTSAPELLAPLAGGDCETWAIICLDWLGDTTRWPTEIDTWVTALAALGPTHIVISVAQFDKVQQQMASAAFDTDVETCQTFLRLVALRHNAGLVYERSNFDWVGFITGNPIDAQVVDDVVIPAGWDSKERILATNPDSKLVETPLESIELPRLRLASALPIPGLLPAQVVQEADFGEILQRAKKTGPPDAQTKISRPESRVETPELSNKQALDHFFTYLIDRSK